MKKSNFAKRVIAFLLVFVMVASLLPLNIMAAKLDIATGTDAGETGIQEDTLNKNGTINWPIKIYDYLADGMLFEFAQADGSVMYSSNKGTTDDYSGQYVLGKPMPPIGVGHDFTADYTYTDSQYVNSQYSTETNRYVKTKMAAVNYQSPQYMRITSSGRWFSNFSTDMNCCIANFPTDNGGAKKGSNIRYMVLVYRSNGINDYGSVPAFKMNVSNEGLSNWNQSNALVDVNGNKMTNSANWRYIVIDIQKSYDSNNWSNMNSGTPVHNIYIRLVQDSTSDYLDLSHVAFFSDPTAAAEFGEQALEFIKEPGEYVSGTYWNGSCNDAFGMLHPSNGAAWNIGGGNALTSTNGGTYAGYYTHSIGYRFPEYYSSASTYNSNRLNGKDSAGRYNGSGSEIGSSNMIYYMMPKTYYTSSGYQAKHPNATSFDMSEIEFDGYSLLTKGTKGVWTAGLLEGQLGADGTPVYRQEAVEYIADVLSKTLVIPQKAENGRNNYAYVAGVKNREQYGYSMVNGKEVANDLAQGLRNCLDIYFEGNYKAKAPVMGTYADTLAKADKLKGAFLAVAPNIDTCIDAAYYLLNNIFVANSYNQEQDDYRYLTLSSAKLDNGQDAYVFDGGFSNGASLADLESGKITQTQYKDQTNSAVVYNGFDSNGDGTISLNTVNEKDLYYYTSSSTTTRYPFLPVTDAEGVYAGETDSYYFAEDGKRSYDVEYGTYKNRNYNYVLASNGEFVYHEEDNLFFEFEGDDDVYLFLNGQLVLDLGGGHSISNSSFNVNDYVVWAREVLKNPSNYTETELARAEALNLENGEIASFDFYYMERHGFGANMRIVTNMHITDPALRVEKSAYQGGKQLDYGGIVDANDPIEYNFKLSNIGNTKLYNLTFDDADIGVTLSPERGLFIVGDDTSSELDDINGYIVTDAHGGRLDAEDLTAVVTGYQNVGTGGNYVQSGHTYTKVEAGTGTHIYYDAITVTFADNNALKNFLENLQSDYTDGDTVDDEQTQRGAGLWVDSSVTFKGIYYTMTDTQEEAGMFDNTVYVTATTRVNADDSASETLRSEARHRVYVTAIPSYYQWADHELFISKQRVTNDAAAESSNESSLLHDYKAFFDKVGTDISLFGTKFCDRLGNVVADGYYENVEIKQAADGNWGYVTDYSETGIYEFFLLMYLYGASGLPSDLSTLKASDLNLGDYAVVRVLVIVADVEDSEYVLDYGLSTENLDTHGELFKNDELYGSLSGTQALLMGFTNEEPSYLKYNEVTDYNRINFNAVNLSENSKLQTEDGYYNVNLAVPSTGKEIKYDEFSGLYTLTESGTTTINVDCPVAWENLYLYYWYDDGRDNAWPGQAMTMTSHGNFTMTIPGNVPHVILSNGTNQTIDLNLNAGQEAWIDIPGTLNDEGKLYATVSYKSADGVIHAKVPEGWGDVYVYCWDVFGHGLTVWPGEKVETIDDDGFYTYTIPGDITNVIINNGDNGKQTEDLTVFAGSETWITVNSTPKSENENLGISYYGATSSRSTETIKVHAKVPDDWDGASLHYWYSNGSSTGVEWPGIAMTKGEDGYYHVEGIPADVTNMIVNDGNEDNARQTEDLNDITPGMEVWLTVNESDAKTIIETTVPSDWGDVYFYFYDNDTAVGSAWPGTKVTAEDGVYSMEAPAGATRLVINNNNDKQSQNLLFALGETNKFTTVSGNTASSEETTLKIYAPSSWSTVNVYYWNDSVGNNGWPGQAASKNSDGSYSFTIPAGYNKLIINNGSAQTSDITEFYMGSENVITVYDDNGYTIFSPSSVGKYTADKVYGESAQKEGITFTPTDFMDSLYSIWMAVTVFENKVEEDDDEQSIQKYATPLGSAINIGKEVQMYKKITVLPANVVYYEDDFAGIKYTAEGTKNVLTHYGDGSGSLSQSVDQDQQYGQDSTYQGSENDEITGGSLTEVTIKENAEFANFEFTGTGFEIIGHTRALDPGTVRVEIRDANGSLVATKAVITEFDNGADGGTESIVAVPIIRFSGLAYGTYKVSIKGVPVYDFDNWVSGAARPPVLDSYILIDGIRIYQPLDNSNSVYENLALGMSCDVKPYIGSVYTADLTDGKYDTSYQAGVNDASWFGFRNTGDSATGNIDPNNNTRAVFTVTLDTESEVKQIRLHHYKGSGADPFTYINVYYSDNGSTFNFLNTINPDPSKTGAYWATLDISETPIDAQYIKFALSAPEGKTVLINEIEIYGTEIVKPGRNDAYIPTENGTAFTEIRNLIAERQAFAVKYDDAAGLSVSGGTSTWIENRNNTLPGNNGVKWTNNEVNSINDYILAGPNNEVYMIESTEEYKTALVFYVQEDNSSVHNMQIAVRALDYGAYIGAEETGYLNAELQYGAMVDGVLVWKHLATTVSSAEQYYTIPYAECPYDADNNRYQVVIRVGDTDITGMASYTSVKLKGLTALTLNTDEVPDVIYTDDINNTIIDSYGNTVDSSKIADLIGLRNQMTAYTVLYSTNNGEAAPEGVDTSALGALYHSFTADSTTDFVLTENSKIYIVTESEDTKPSAETIETAQLVQTQFMADELPSAEPLQIVWGLEKYATEGDIIIYANQSGYSAEKYKVEVSDRAKVYAGDDNGLLYALNTLQKHFRYAKTNAVEGFTVEDYPQTAERTVHLDVARKYLTKDWINNYIKEMSWMGYNALELHFSEDGGFRADFWDPEYFTSENNNDFSWTVGSRTQYWVNDPYKTDPDAGKYLTAAELVEICNTAKLYNIEIIPSFDTPAHVDWLTWNYYNTYSSNGVYKSFNYNGTTYTLPTYLNYRTTSTYDSRWAVLDLGNDTVQKFAFAMYKDIADFFTQYAGSTKFNIGGDEVGLTTTDTWDYRDFYLYVNDLNTLLNNEGYTVRIYNDFLDRSTYIQQVTNKGLTMPTLASNIEIVYWTADGAVQPASNFESQDRKIYNGMNYWTYYVLRIADASSVGSNNKGRDARDPNNTWWSFYRNQEDYVYNEWNPTLFSAYNASTKYTIWDDTLAGGYFMVWNDYAALNTEVEMWNGVYDKTGVSGTSNNYYSLIERMWSNSIKQWHWGIHNSTYEGNQTTFARYETLRDKLGFFPGYVQTATGSYAKACTLPTPTDVSDEAYRTLYTVTFVNYDGTVIDTQKVKEGFSATAPADPERPSDVWYDYTFTGWDGDFTNITENTVLTAEYSEKATTAGKIGYFEVLVSGGTNFTMSIEGSAAKSMGVEYVNPSMEFGKAVTVTAQTTNGNNFVAWFDAKNGEILSSSAAYSFFTSGNDVLIALYETDISETGLVIFKNDKTNQVIDIQYYTADDTIEFPSDISYPGYEFVGWSHSEAEIKELLAQGKSVTVTPLWMDKTVYFAVSVSGGSIIESSNMVGDKYLGYKSVTVQADEAPSGKIFAYWVDEEGNVLSYETVYKFYPFKDTELTAIFLSDKSTGVGITGTKPLPETDEEKDTVTVYFENNWNWSDVRIHYWGAGETQWPGDSMSFVEKVGEYDVYSYEVPAGVTGIIFNGIKDDGSGSRDQSPNIESGIVDGRMYRMKWDNGNAVEIDDSRISNDTQTVYSTLYVYVHEEMEKDNAWFAVHAWEADDISSDVWMALERVSDGLYKALIPEIYSGIEIFKMTCASGVFDTTDSQSLLNGTISPDDEQNTVVVNEDGSEYHFINVVTAFFVNEFGWETVEAYYTDDFGTHKAQLTFVEKDSNGNDVYSMEIPEDVAKITFTNGTESYKYVSAENIADRSIFGSAVVDTIVEKEPTINVGFDTETFADSDIVVFDWSVSEGSDNTFVNVGVLLVKEEDYVESTFVKGTIDPNVIQFAPAKRYQTSTGIHSITIPHVAVGDGWIACAFIQYKDAEGNLRTKYSKQVTGKK